MTTEVANVFNELGAGTFQSALQQAVNELNEKVREHGSFGKQGELGIKVKFTPAKDGDQLILSSTLFKKVPTETGHMSETINHETPFFIDGNGDMCAYVPEEGEGGQQNITEF